MYFTSRSHFALLYPNAGKFVVIHPIISAARKSLLFCNCAFASVAFVVGKTLGALNTSAFADASVLTVPFCKISIISSNAISPLVSAVPV